MQNRVYLLFVYKIRAVILSGHDHFLKSAGLGIRNVSNHGLDFHFNFRFCVHQMIHNTKLQTARLFLDEHHHLVQMPFPYYGLIKTCTG